VNAISEYLVSHIVAVYFAYGLAFFVFGVSLLFAGRRESSFRFASVLLPLALFGLLHSAHEWYEMFQLIAMRSGSYVPLLWHEALRVVLLTSSFLLLLVFAILLLGPQAGRRQRAFWASAGLLTLYAISVIAAARFYDASYEVAIGLADVFARYIIGAPAAVLAAWALMAQQREFRESNMSEFGASLVWCAAVLILYGLVGQLFVRSTPLPISSVFNSVNFLEWFGIPVQLFRAILAGVLTFFMLRVLRVFDTEERRRLATTNDARLAAARESSVKLAIVNDELKLAMQQLTLLVDVTNALHGVRPWQEALNNALQQIVDKLAFAKSGLILFAAPDKGAIRVAAETGYDSPDTPGQVPSTNEMEEARTLGEACIEDGLLHCLHVDGSEMRITPEVALRERPCLSANSPVTHFALPLASRDRTIGCIVLTNDRNHQAALTPVDLGLTVGLSQELGLALENALLHSQARRHERALEELLGQVVKAQEGERQRIARELHDATGQSLTAIGLGLRGVQASLERARGRDCLPHQAILLRQLDAVLSYNSDAMRELHNIISDLRPPLLDELGLDAATKWYAETIERRANIPIHVDSCGDARALSTDYNTVLFRILQEALGNVVKHADASSVEVALLFGDNHATLSVTDDGRGFEPPADFESAEQSGWGLAGMRERAALVGGTFDVVSAPGMGTAVTVRIPLPVVNGPAEDG